MATRKETGKNLKSTPLKSTQRLTSLFALFNEIGIISQLSTAAFNRVLPEGIHVAHFSVLNHLFRLGDGKTPVQLADAFQITKGTMTHTLNELQKRKFIDIKPNPEDRRSKLVYLTRKGRTFREHAINSLQPMVEAISGDLDIELVLNAAPALKHLREVLDNNR
ncbi:MAG: MarR family transcriptional regulator [Pseudomonadota bacterium]